MRVSSWLYLLEQTCCSAGLLLSVGLCAGFRRASPFRLLATALLLGMLTLLSAAAVPWIRTVLFPLSVFAPLMAWPAVPARLRWRMSLMFLALSMWMVGLMRLMQPLALPGMLLVLTGCVLLRLLPLLTRRTPPAPAVTSVELQLGARRTTLTALIDSGNLLRDVITGLPVIVISRRSAARLLSLPRDGKLAPGMRLMSVRTVSGTAMMTILRPDSIRLLYGSRWQKAEALIGLSPDGYEGFQALVPASLAVRERAPIPRKAISQGG